MSARAGGRSVRTALFGSFHLRCHDCTPAAAWLDYDFVISGSDGWAPSPASGWPLRSRLGKSKAAAVMTLRSRLLQSLEQPPPTERTHHASQDDPTRPSTHLLRRSRR